MSLMLAGLLSGLLSCSKSNTPKPAAAESTGSIVGYWYMPATGNEFTRGIWFKADGTLRAYDDGISGPKLADTGANHYFGSGTYTVKDNIVTFSVDGVILPIIDDNQLGQLDFSANPATITLGTTATGFHGMVYEQQKQ